MSSSTTSSDFGTDAAETGSAKRFLWRCLGLVLLALVVQAAFQVAIDPRGNLGTGIAAVAPWRSHFGRVSKARQLASSDYDLVILGTSRSLNGIDPQDSAFGNRRVFNASLVGTNFVETGYVFDYLLEHHVPKELLIEVSLLTFGSSRSTARDFEESAFNPERERVEAFLADVLGLESLRQAVSLTRRWLTGQPRELVPRSDGMRMRVGDPSSTRELFATVLTNFAGDPNTYGEFAFGEDRLALLSAMVQRATDAGLKVTLFTPPVHALQLETIQRLGLQEDYDHMRREVAGIASSHLASEVAYWDFTAWTGPPSEALPASDGDPLQWYFDSSHFRPALGALVLSRIFGTSTGAITTEGFGLQLSALNVDQHLSDGVLARARWSESHPDSVRWLRELLAKP